MMIVTLNNLLNDLILQTQVLRLNSMSTHTHLHVTDIDLVLSTVNEEGKVRQRHTHLRLLTKLALMDFENQ